MTPPYAIYERIKTSIIDDIESGKLKPDDKILSENELASRFNASRMTANRALKELKEEGRIVRVHGVGSFVSRPKPDAALLEIKSIALEIDAWGGRHSAEVVVLEKTITDDTIAQKMEIPVNDPVFHSVIIHMDSGIPIQYSERYISPTVAPLYLEQDFKNTTPSEYLLSIAPVRQAEHSIEAVIPDPDVRGYLDIASEEPCICLKRRTWSFNRVATFTTMISPGSRYKLKGRFSPKGKM